MKTADAKTQQTVNDIDQLSDEALECVIGGVGLSGLLTGTDEDKDSTALFSQPMVASFFHIKWPQRK